MGHRHSDMVRRLVVSVGCLSVWLAHQAAGQEGAALVGAVTDRSTGKPVASAQIIYLRDSRAVTSDSLGKYTFKGLAGGVAQLIVRATNFPAQQIIIELTAGQETVRPIVLDSTAFGRLAAAQTLPAVAVTAEAAADNYRLVDFERRRHTGHGQYRDEGDLVKSGAYSLQDAVIAMRGVDMDCSKSNAANSNCKIHMVRAPASCQPEYVVDGRADNDFGPLTPIRDIVALEVYTGPSDVPGEFAGRNSGCGVVVIWTRSGPTRKRKP